MKKITKFITLALLIVSIFSATDKVNAQQTTPCYSFNVNLQIGSTGSDVSALQKFLTSKGFTTEDTGYFGKDTFASLKSYQAGIGLPATGFFGPLSRGLVNEYCNVSASISWVAGKAADNGEVDAGSSAQISGTNLTSGVGTKVFVGDVEAKITQIDSTLIYATMPTSLKVGEYYYVYLTNTSGEIKSNKVRVKVLSSVVTTETSPSPSSTAISSVVVDSSKLDLVYDDKKEESSLVATFKIRIDGGKSGINVYKYTGGVLFYDQNGKSQNLNSESYSLELNGKLDTTTDDYGQSLYSIPAGKTASFTMTAKVSPKQMFAGTYYASLKGLYVNYGNTLTQSTNITVRDNKTNTKIIVGEKSPFITSISNTVRVGDKLVINGVRFNAKNKFTINISGKSYDSKTYSVTSDGKKIEMKVPQLANGTHTLYLVDPVTGESNKFLLTVSGTNNSPSPSVTPTVTPVISDTPVLKEIWTTGMSFKNGDTINFNIKPNTIEGGYNLNLEALNENGVKIADITKSECPTAYVCTPKLSWKPSKDLFTNGDRQFIVRAVLKKGNTEISSVKTDKIYVSSPNTYENKNVILTPSVSPTATPAITLSVSSSKVNYKQDEIITLDLNAYNNTNEAITLDFNSDCRRTYTVGTYDSKAGLTCGTAKGSSAVVKANSKYSWQIQHNPSSYQLPVGENTFNVYLNATNKNNFSGVVWSASLPVRISAPSTSNSSSVINSIRSFFGI